MYSYQFFLPSQITQTYLKYHLHVLACTRVGGTFVSTENHRRCLTWGQLFHVIRQRDCESILILYRPRYLCRSKFQPQVSTSTFKTGVNFFMLSDNARLWIHSRPRYLHRSKFVFQDPIFILAWLKAHSAGKDTEFDLFRVIALMISTLNSELHYRCIQEYRMNAYQWDNQCICNSWTTEVRNGFPKSEIFLWAEPAHGHLHHRRAQPRRQHRLLLLLSLHTRHGPSVYGGGLSYSLLSGSSLAMFASFAFFMFLILRLSDTHLLLWGQSLGARGSVSP